MAESRLYRKPWEESRRCIVPAEWFVEWRGEKGRKQKLRIKEEGRAAMRIAGLWDASERGSQTFTMLTVEPNEFMRSIHHRMVSLLRPEDEAEWLSPDCAPEDALRLLRPYEGTLMIEAPTDSEATVASNRENS